MKMKKLLALLLAMVMVFSLAACNKTSEEPADTADNTTEDQGQEEGSTLATYTLGFGVVVEDGTTDEKGQVNTTFAAVVTDADGVIVACQLDVAQLTMAIAGGVADVEGVDLRSKQEKGDDYGMAAIMGTTEWYEQANHFEASIVGMTAADVAGIPTEVNEEGHTVAIDDVISAGCTISIASFQEAVAKAIADPYAKTFEAEADSFKLGIGVESTVEGSTSYDANAETPDGVFLGYTGMAAVVVDANGVILADLVDYVQPKVNFDANGVETAFNFGGSKKELGDDYGMAAIMQTTEWYAQATCFENYVVGMTADQVTGIATASDDGEHYRPTDADPDLQAGCTISITGFQATVAEACANAQ